MKHYLSIILIDDPTININNPDVQWFYDPIVFIKHKEVWQKYMNNDADILCLFRNTEKNLKEDHYLDINNNTLSIKGNHKYGAIENPLKTMKYLNYYYTYDYLLTTTSSCFWVLPKLKIILTQLPKTGIYFGSTAYPEPKYGNAIFVSGSGIIMSRDVVQLLINDIDILSQDKDTPDDVIISKCLFKHNVLPTHYPRYDFVDNRIDNVEQRIIETNNQNICQYRAKNEANRLYYDTIILYALYVYYYAEYKNKL